MMNCPSHKVLELEDEGDKGEPLKSRFVVRERIGDNKVRAEFSKSNNVYTFEVSPCEVWIMPALEPRGE